MNYIDLFIAIPLLWGAYRGFCKGMLIELASLLALGLGIYGGIKFSDQAAAFLSDHFAINAGYLPLIAFGVVFILIVILVYTLAKILEKIINLLALKLVNKLLGALFGLFKTALILSVILLIVNIIDNKINFITPDQKESSILYTPVSAIATTIIPVAYQENWSSFYQADGE